MAPDPLEEAAALAVQFREQAALARGVGNAALGELSIKLAEIAESFAFKPTHRHLKRGSVYQLLSRNGRIEKTWEPAAIYRTDKDEWIARALAEFDDGRFEKL